MALTSGEYEAQANRLRSQMGETVDKLRSNLTPSNLASEAASRVGVSELSWRGALDFASTRHRGPTAIAGFGVALWLLAAARKPQQRGCPRGDLTASGLFLFTCRHCNARVSRASGDQAARVYRRSADPGCERRGDALRRDRRQARGCDRSYARRLSSPAAHRIDCAGGARGSAGSALTETSAQVIAVGPSPAMFSLGRLRPRRRQEVVSLLCY
jgi:hypothetical protein